MKNEQEVINQAVFTTVFESMTAILFRTLNIEEMEKMVDRLNRWVEDHKESMRRHERPG